MRERAPLQNSRAHAEIVVWVRARWTRPLQKLQRSEEPTADEGCGVPIFMPTRLSNLPWWLNEALSAGMIEPNAMSLATAWQDARPSVRTVLLKSLDSRGFVFYTNLESRKARQLDENPNASLLFPWLALERQESSQVRFLASRPVR